MFGVHFNVLYRDSHTFAPIAALTRQGAVGVGFFFTLSGFVLTWSHAGASLSKTAFWWRRTARILPAYLAAWVLAMVVTADDRAPHAESFLVRGLLNITLLQAWIPEATWSSGGNAVGWFLSAEAFFYACLLFLINPITRAEHKVQLLVLASALVTTIAIPLTRHPDPATIAHQVEWGYWAIYMSPTTRILEFVAGIDIAAYMRSEGRVRFPLPLATTITAAAYIAAGQVPTYAGLVAATAAPFVLLIATCAETDRSGRPSLLRHPWPSPSVHGPTASTSSTSSSSALPKPTSFSAEPPTP